MHYGLSALEGSSALRSINALLSEAHELLLRDHNFFLIIIFTGANSIVLLSLISLGPYYSKSLY